MVISGKMHGVVSRLCRSLENKPNSNRGIKVLYEMSHISTAFYLILPRTSNLVSPLLNVRQNAEKDLFEVVKYLSSATTKKVHSKGKWMHKTYPSISNCHLTSVTLPFISQTNKKLPPRMHFKSSTIKITSKYSHTPINDDA